MSETPHDPGCSRNGSTGPSGGIQTTDLQDPRVLDSRGEEELLTAKALAVYSSRGSASTHFLPAHGSNRKVRVGSSAPSKERLIGQRRALPMAKKQLGLFAATLQLTFALLGALGRSGYRLANQAPRHRSVERLSSLLGVSRGTG